MTRWRYAAATDTGLVRQTNQDALYADDSLAIIADGMGGHAAGEVAAAMAIDLVRRGFHEHPNVEALVDAIQDANTVVVTDARENPEHFGMGTTVIAVGITYDLNGVGIADLGARRRLTRLPAARWRIAPADRRPQRRRRVGSDGPPHPRRGGGSSASTPTDARRRRRRHDRHRRDVHQRRSPAIDILLCSDGLSNELDSDTLARLASAPNGLEFAVESLGECGQGGGRVTTTSRSSCSSSTRSTSPRPPFVAP